jgi:hypothetical protein
MKGPRRDPRLQAWAHSRPNVGADFPPRSRHTDKQVGDGGEEGRTKHINKSSRGAAPEHGRGHASAAAAAAPLEVGPGTSVGGTRHQWKWDQAPVEVGPGTSGSGTRYKWKWDQVPMEVGPVTSGSGTRYQWKCDQLPVEMEPDTNGSESRYPWKWDQVPVGVGPGTSGNVILINEAAARLAGPQSSCGNVSPFVVASAPPPGPVGRVWRERCAYTVHVHCAR